MVPRPDDSVTLSGECGRERVKYSYVWGAFLSDLRHTGTSTHRHKWCRFRSRNPREDPEETPNVKDQVVVVLVVPDHDHRCMLRGAMVAPKRHHYQVLEETDPEQNVGALRMARHLRMAPPEITMVGEAPVAHLVKLA